jgi:phospholipid/cholesterol/gamma-HCH transport system substrate-binding protein
MFERVPPSKRFILHISALILAIIGLFTILSSEVAGFSNKDYVIFFSSSTSGLKVGSAVQYQGVKIGVVSAIKVDLPNAYRVKVRISIDKNIPIYEDTVAKLGMQGLTGYSIIELYLPQDENLRTSTKVLSGFAPEIKSESSVIDRLSQDLPILISKAAAFFSTLNKAVDGGRLKKTLQNIHLISKKFAMTLDNFNILISDLRLAVRKIDLEVLDPANSVLKNFDEILKGSKDSIVKFSKVGLPKAIDLIDNLNEGAKSLRSILKALPAGAIGSWIGAVDEN